MLFSQVRIPWERDPLDGAGLWVYVPQGQRGKVEIAATVKPFVQWQGPYTDRLRLELLEVAVPVPVTLSLSLWSQDCDTPGPLVTSGNIVVNSSTRGTVLIARGFPSFGWAVGVAVTAGNVEPIITLRASVDRIGGDPVVTKGLLT